MAHHHEHHHCESCAHEHHHEESGIKHQLILICSTVLLLVAAVLIERYFNLPTWQLLIVYLIPYLLIGHETLIEAFEGVCHAQTIGCQRGSSHSKTGLTKRSAPVGYAAEYLIGVTVFFDDWVII